MVLVRWIAYAVMAAIVHCYTEYKRFFKVYCNTQVYVQVGGLPGTLCYVAMQPCSLDSLSFACTLITVCKKGIFRKQNG